MKNKLLILYIALFYFYSISILYAEVIKEIDDNYLSIPTKNYIDSKISELEKTMNLELAIRDKALIVAKEDLDRRLESMNEFRKDLDKQQGTFLSKSDYDLKNEKLCSDIQGLKETRAELRGMASQSYVNITLTIALLSILLGIASLLLQYKKRKE